MYERMLNKRQKPDRKDFVSYIGSAGAQFEQIDRFLTEELKTDKLLRFPYGNNYGWGIKYFIKSRHICDIFAENNAFTVTMRLASRDFPELYDEVSEYTKQVLDRIYPCGEGGWIHYRVLETDDLHDIKTLLRMKA